MQAIILAGGVGTRLHPLTEKRQKTLMPILNKPLLSYTLEKLEKLGGLVDRIVIAVSYRSEQVREYVKTVADAAYGSADLIVVEEKTLLGTGGAIKNAERYISDRFLVFNGDIVTGLDLKSFLAFHEKACGIASIALHEVDEPEHFGVVAMEGTRITKFVEKPKRENAPSKLINAGTYCLEYEVFDVIEPDTVVSMEREVFPKLIERGKALHGFVSDDYWLDVGRPETCIEIQSILLKRQNRPFCVGERCVIHGTLENVCLGAGTRIGEGARVCDSILMKNVRVGANAIISGSIIGDGCIIGRNAVIKNALIADGAVVQEDGVLENVKVTGQCTIEKR